MKLLKIEDNQGHFLDEQGVFAVIEKITKKDLLRLVDITLSEEVEFDEYDEETIRNHAHQILYRNILEKLQGLRDRKQEFVDESERLYLEDYEKYQDKSSQQGVEGDTAPSAP